MGLEELRRSVELRERLDTAAIESARHDNTLKHGKKPLMERYRRQKINNYLEELKNLVLSALNKEVSRYNKMEKADILDMAVKYIKAVRATTPEGQTMNYGQHHEYNPSLVLRYQQQGTSPLAAQPTNTNYETLYRTQQETQANQMNEMKENWITFEEGKYSEQSCFNPATRSLTGGRHSSQQAQSPETKDLLVRSRNENSVALATTTLGEARCSSKNVYTPEVKEAFCKSPKLDFLPLTTKTWGEAQHLPQQFNTGEAKSLFANSLSYQRDNHAPAAEVARFTKIWRPW